MDFNLSEDRQMLSDTLRRYLSDQYDWEKRNAVAYAEPFHSPQNWSELAEMGLLGAFITEEQGGFGGEGFDISVIFEELGRALCPEPMLANLIGVRLLAACGQSELVEEIVSGETRVAFAAFEPDSANSIDYITTVATSNGASWNLSGRKSMVYGANAAQKLLVAAKNGDNIAVFLVDDADIFSFAMIDGGGAGEVTLDNTPARLIKDNAAEEINAALDAARLALCAEALGASEVIHDMTVDYLKQRVQFGRAIATNQALQHRIVDMAIEIEQLRSIVILAASKLDTDERAHFVSVAKNLTGRVAKLVAEEAVQLHGGIGMTWEYPGSHYAKRLIMIDHQLGDRYEHLARVMAA